MRFALMILGLALFMSCSEDEKPTDPDILFARWKLISTSGTITGAGITTDWDEVELNEKEAIFYKGSVMLVKAGVVIDGEKITFGFIESSITPPVADLKGDGIKIIKYITKDELHLNSECCDRVDYQLKRNN
jgi:hypothetical protein